MKTGKSSIKTRVTMYYSLTLIFVSALLVAILISSMIYQVGVVSRDTVMKAAQDAFDDIEYRDEYIQIDSDFDSYRKGVTLLVYSSEGDLIKGSLPEDFPYYTPLTNGDFTDIRCDDEKYLVYDLYNTYENNEGLWIRAIYPEDISLLAIRKLLLLVLIGIPVIIAVAITAGRRITSAAFEPIAEISEAAESISSGDDLSVRLPAREGSRDELDTLSVTLNEMIERLEQAFENEKQFTSDVSHELKTPVSVILAQCEYALSDVETDEEYKVALNTIVGQCRKMMSLIQQMLQLSRTLTSDSVLEKEYFDISQLCTSVAKETEILAEKKNVKVITDISPDISCYGDETLILRMIMNLMTNAVKYSEPERVESYVKLKLDNNDSDIVISVEDNGKGISDEDFPYIFNRLYKGDYSRSEDDTSFGLGLSMVKWIAEAHKGTVETESEKGKGSIFTVHIPKAG